MGVAVGEIVGRGPELEKIEHVLAEVGPRALVLEGEPGIGKTTLWRHGVELARARGFRVLTAQPVEAERELSYAALGDLVAPVVADIGRLPAPQRRSLRVALLLAETRGAPPEARAVAVALSSFLRLLADERPLLIAVDDVQWLDGPTATVLAFAARRLDHPDQLLFAARRIGEPAIEFEGADRVTVGPLDAADIDLLVRHHLDVRFVTSTLEHLQRVSGGNPLYALELARELVLRAEPLRASDPLPIPQSLHQLITGRLERMPQRTRDALAVAAALARPTTTVVEACIGSDVDLEPAVHAGVARPRAGVIEFAHPLFASVLYSGLDEPARRRIHRRLADLVDDLEERAQHLAAAADQPDEAAATLLEQASVAAVNRGAATSALGLAERAVELTAADSPAAVDRRLAAAALQFDAGDARAAQEALERLAPSTRGEERARVLLLLGRVAGEVRGVEAAAHVYREALGALSHDAPNSLVALVNARLAQAARGAGHNADESFGYAETAVAAAEAAGNAAVLAECLAIMAQLRFWHDGVVQTELLERALAIAPETGNWVNNPTLIYAQQYVDQGDVGVSRPMIERAIARARERHDPSLTHALVWLAWIEIRVGNTRRAIEIAEESHEVARHAGRGDYAVEALAPAAMARSIVGDLQECRRAIAVLREHGVYRPAVDMAEGLLELSLRDYEAARVVHTEGLRAADGPARASEVAGLGEALVALGEIARARALLEAEWDAGAELKSVPGARFWHVRGLLLDAEGDADGAEAAFRRALDVYDGFTSNPVHRGRVRLSLGAALRRRRQKRSAREAIEAALRDLAAADAAIWAQHAHAELAVIGGRPSSAGTLTNTERRIAELVAEGRSNQNVALELHMSPKTIEWNLTKVYRKLNVTSRAELGPKLALRQSARG